MDQERNPTPCPLKDWRNNMRRTFLCAFAVVMLLSSMANAEAPVNAEQPVTSDPAQNQPKEYQAGQDYIVLPGKSKAAKNSKIKVVSFFWYGCGGCYGVDPYVSDWSKKLPDDVEFVRMPALFNPTWEFHGQIFFALDAMNPKPQADIHSKVFDAFRNKHIKVNSRDELPAFVESLGLDSKVFMAAFDSKEVRTKMDQARKLMDEYELDVVPAMVINDKYRFDLGKVDGPDEYTALADALLAKARTE